MMRKNSSLKEMARELIKAESVLIFPHVLMDGDALGSAAALCGTLRNLGKKAYILVEDPVPQYLQFLDKGYCTEDQEILGDQDISIAVDCGDDKRFPRRAKRFHRAKVEMCVDHHRTSQGIYDYNYIDPGAAATGEIVYDLLLAMEAEVSKEGAEALFAAITTDTGNFQYSNTTKRTHQIVMELYDLGFDSNAVSVELYENETMEKLLLHSKVMDTLEIIVGGRGAIATLTQKMLRECNAKMEHSEGIVEIIRSIKGVEVAMLLKENDTSLVKVSMRSKRQVDVADIAEKYHGGGHIRAAGCTLHKTMENAREIMVEELKKVL
jgi:phosphoesterase RecJ-like protein